MAWDFEYNKRILTAYGLIPLDAQSCETEMIDCNIFTFSDQDNDTIGVTAWSGSWPFPVDHDKGCFHTIEDAAKYARWLELRELFFYQMLDKHLGTPDAD
jgi:hypothetical protein